MLTHYFYTTVSPLGDAASVKVNIVIKFFFK